jgi:transcriptional regulator with XRE-family HTH domain
LRNPNVPQYIVEERILDPSTDSLHPRATPVAENATNPGHPIRRRGRRRRPRRRALVRRRYALNVLARRRQLAWTQEDLANACGCSPCDVSRIERGRINPTRKKLRRLAFVFHCEVRALLRKPPEELRWIEIAPIPVRSHLVPDILRPISPSVSRYRRKDPRWDGPYVPRLPTTQELAAWANDNFDDRVSEEWDRDFDYDDIIADCERYRRQLDDFDLT